MDVFKNSNTDNIYHTFYNIVVSYHIGILSMSLDINGSLYIIHGKGMTSKPAEVLNFLTCFVITKLFALVSQRRF
jgi:hypothetical protein